MLNVTLFSRLYPSLLARRVTPANRSSNPSIRVTLTSHVLKTPNTIGNCYPFFPYKHSLKENNNKLLRYIKLLSIGSVANVYHMLLICRCFSVLFVTDCSTVCAFYPCCSPLLGFRRTIPSRYIQNRLSQPCKPIIITVK